MSDKPQDESIKDQIIALLSKGYTRVQLIKDFRFAERTVDNAIKEYKEQHVDGSDESNKNNSEKHGGFDGSTGHRDDFRFNFYNICCSFLRC